MTKCDQPLPSHSSSELFPEAGLHLCHLITRRTALLTSKFFFSVPNMDSIAVRVTRHGLQVGREGEPCRNRHRYQTSGMEGKFNPVSLVYEPPFSISAEQSRAVDRHNKPGLREWPASLRPPCTFIHDWDFVSRIPCQYPLMAVVTACSPSCRAWLSQNVRNAIAFR